MTDINETITFWEGVAKLFDNKKGVCVLITDGNHWPRSAVEKWGIVSKL